LLRRLAMPSVDEVLVAKRAYEIWEGEGRPHGRDREHWLMAVTELSTSIVAEPVASTQVKVPTPRLVATSAGPAALDGPGSPTASKIAARMKEAVTVPARAKRAARGKR
jgi:hypothetical protein